MSWFVAAAVAGIGCQAHSVAERMDCSSCQKQSAAAGLLIAAACNLAVAAETGFDRTLSVEVETRSGSQSADSGSR